MKLTLLGTGTPCPSVDRNCTVNLVQTDAQNIIIDAGRGVVTQLINIGVDPNAIDIIFITHHHFDHIGNLADLLLAGWNNGRARVVHVYGPNGTVAIIDQFFNGIYARDIAFRLHGARYLNKDVPDIRELVIACDIAVGDVIEGPDWQIQAFQVEHGHSLGMNHDDWPCYGYRLTTDDGVLGISGDTVDCEGVRALACDADLLVQCCYLADAHAQTPDLRVLVDHVLASAKQAGEIAQAAGVKRMVLTHLAPQSDERLAVVLAEAQAQCKASVILGADLMALEI